MDFFEYLRTAFHVMKAVVDQDLLFYIGLGILCLFVVWSVLSLIFCHEAKCSRIWGKMQKHLDGIVTPEKYFAFTPYFKKLPVASARNWKKYEQVKTGKPSDYLSQLDMLDNPISGGVQKQNRSIMKFAISCVTVLCFLLSFAGLGGDEPLTAKIVCESLLVPLVLFLLYRINYYIYTVIRQHTYRMAVEEFHDFVDFLDSKIDINSIFEGNENCLDMSSNCYTNCIVIEKQEEKREQIQTLASKVETKKEKTKKDFYRNKSGNIEIRSQEEFVDALNVVEKLLDQKTTVPSEKDEKTKKVAELMDAMNKYRNKKIK